jgi:hypothetical protein
MYQLALDICSSGLNVTITCKYKHVHKHKLVFKHRKEIQLNYTFDL